MDGVLVPERGVGWGGAVEWSVFHDAAARSASAECA